MNSDTRALDLASELVNQGYEVTAKVWVEPQTLKKVVRESVENQEKINLDIFDAQIGNYVDIKGV